MLTGDGKLFATLSVMLPSDWIAPAPMLTAMDPATAALAVGSVLTVDRTLACALATPARSAEPTHWAMDDRRNRMVVGAKALGRRCARRGYSSAPLRRSS